MEVSVSWTLEKRRVSAWRMSTAEMSSSEGGDDDGGRKAAWLTRRRVEVQSEKKERGPPG